jgi:predicted nucleotidyltransferase component of viral defense system
LSLPVEILKPIPMAVHRVYDFQVPAVPVVNQVEAIAEKLARFRRVDLARDLYDLFWYASRPFDELRLRRLWVLKTYRDIVQDGRGNKPIDPEQVLHTRQASDFHNENIGYLTGKVDITTWITTIQHRFSFLHDLDEDEQRWCECNPRDNYEVAKALTTITDWMPSEPTTVDDY